jgi:hypothetical protein
MSKKLSEVVKLLEANLDNYFIVKYTGNVFQIERTNLLNDYIQREMPATHEPLMLVEHLQSWLLEQQVFIENKK